MKEHKNVTLDHLKPGQKAKIDTFTDYEMSLKLMEMGCVPGEIVILKHIAPLGDPIAISVSGYLLSLRKKEASTIIVIVLSED